MFKIVNIGCHHGRTAACALLLGLMLSGQCFGLDKPRLRISDYFGAPGGIHYLDPDDIGQHSYKKSRHEKKGMLYTQRGGFFDLGHVREAADRTRYAVYVLEGNILKSNKRFKFSMIEPSQYYVLIQYPDNWKYLDRDEQREIAREVSLLYGQYLAHQSLVWHELLTWFGYASSGLFSEQISSFSWEDPFSDVTGTWLGAEAIRNGGSYDDQVTQLLAEKLEELKAEPASVGKKAEARIKDTWYSGGGYFFVTMKKRNFDVGFDDGYVTPWLVPGMYDDAEPLACPIPRADAVSSYGFKFIVQLDPRASEKSKIYKAANVDSMKPRLQIDIHFPVLLEYIRKEAEAKDGHAVALPTL